MSAYLIINIFIAFVPLLLSFEKNVCFYKKLKNVFVSILIVGIIFLIWDAIATKTGDWSFNPEYTGRISLFGLPLEEVLFFITVPYSILFVYESLSFYLKETSFGYSNKYFLIISAIFFISALMNLNKNYTSVVLIFCGILFILSFIFDLNIYRSKISVLTILISFIPFFIVNFVLTSLPVVQYSAEAIIGIRIFTIPAEDFFYSFAMISCWLIVYEYLKTKEVKVSMTNK